MHELSIAEGVFDIVRQYVPPDEARGVRSVRMKIGALAGVVPDSLEFCFHAIIQGTSLEGAALDIERIPLVLDCRACGLRSNGELSMFVCPSCGSGNVAVASGLELQVTEIELED
jgi:hydrogenase nickel incorporation protein HypA/HybF